MGVGFGLASAGNLALNTSLGLFGLGSYLAGLNQIAWAWRNISSSQSAAAQQGAKLVGIGTGMIVGFGAIANSMKTFAQESIRAATAFRSTEFGFTTLLKDGDKAKRLMKDIQKFALETPFDFAQSAASARRVMAAGYSDPRQIMRVLNSVGSAVSATGGGDVEFKRVMKAVGDLKARGSAGVSAQDLNQFTNAGIPARLILQQSLGDKAKGGKAGMLGSLISSEKALDVLLDYFEGHWASAFKRMAKEPAGIAGAMSDTMNQVKVSVGNLLLPSMMAAQVRVTKLLKSFLDLNPETQKLYVYAAGAAVGFGILGGVVLATAGAMAVFNAQQTISGGATGLKGILQMSAGFLKFTAIIGALVIGWNLLHTALQNNGTWSKQRSSLEEFTRQVGLLIDRVQNLYGLLAEGPNTRRGLDSTGQTNMFATDANRERAQINHNEFDSVSGIRDRYQSWVETGAISRDAAQERVRQEQASTLDRTASRFAAQGFNTDAHNRRALAGQLRSGNRVLEDDPDAFETLRWSRQGIQNALPRNNDQQSTPGNFIIPGLLERFGGRTMLPTGNRMPIPGLDASSPLSIALNNNSVALRLNTAAVGSRATHSPSGSDSFTTSVAGMLQVYDPATGRTTSTNTSTGASSTTGLASRIGALTNPVNNAVNLNAPNLVNQNPTNNRRSGYANLGIGAAIVGGGLAVRRVVGPYKAAMHAHMDLLAEARRDIIRFNSSGRTLGSDLRTLLSEQAAQIAKIGPRATGRTMGGGWVNTELEGIAKEIERVNRAITRNQSRIAGATTRMQDLQKNIPNLLNRLRGAARNGNLRAGARSAGRWVGGQVRGAITTADNFVQDAYSVSRNIPRAFNRGVIGSLARRNLTNYGKSVYQSFGRGFKNLFVNKNAPAAPHAVPTKFSRGLGALEGISSGFGAYKDMQALGNDNTTSALYGLGVGGSIAALSLSGATAASFGAVGLPLIGLAAAGRGVSAERSGRQEEEAINGNYRLNNKVYSNSLSDKQIQLDYDQQAKIYEQKSKELTNQAITRGDVQNSEGGGMFSSLRLGWKDVVSRINGGGGIAAEVTKEAQGTLAQAKIFAQTAEEYKNRAKNGQHSPAVMRRMQAELQASVGGAQSAVTSAVTDPLAGLSGFNKSLEARLRRMTSEANAEIAKQYASLYGLKFEKGVWGTLSSPEQVRNANNAQFDGEGLDVIRQFASGMGLGNARGKFIPGRKGGGQMVIDMAPSYGDNVANGLESNVRRKAKGGAVGR